MPSRQLSPREEEIVELCAQGLTNEQIAYQLGISIGTVNTYWLRIKFKVGGLGKTDTVVKVLQERAEHALRGGDTNRDLSEIVAERTEHIMQYRIAVSLLQLALSELKSVVWATDVDLRIHLIANGDFPATHLGVKWEAGKTVYDLFGTTNENHPAIAAHLQAVNGEEAHTRLQGHFANMSLRVLPIRDDGNVEVLGCISILNTVPM